ncbi:MAG: hypothetical protein ACE5J3_12530, partial [Methanosarcinales archaeon]
DQEKRLIIWLNQNQDFGKKYYNKVIACMEIEGKWKVIAVADTIESVLKKARDIVPKEKWESIELSSFKEEDLFTI